jgi:hypothetical protein
MTNKSKNGMKNKLLGDEIEYESHMHQNTKKEMMKTNKEL